jgi:hypothetical protein
LLQAIRAVERRLAMLENKDNMGSAQDRD